MLNGLYGYIFGSEDSNDSQISQGSGVFSVDKTIENDWCLVEDVSSGRSSPVFIPYPEMRDIDQLSFTSKNGIQPPSHDAIQRSEQFRQARANTAQRLHLEKLLFADTESSLYTVPVTRSLKTKKSLISASKLKRGTASLHVNSQSKTKQRSKKVVNLSSGRNNNRKVNNYD